MSDNWKKDLDDSLRIVKNAFLTEGIENISVEKSKDDIQKMLQFAQLLEDTVNGRGVVF